MSFFREQHLCSIEEPGKPAYVALNQAATDLVGTMVKDPRDGSNYAMFTTSDAEEVGLLDPVDLKGIYDLKLLNKILRALGEPTVSSK
jgi:NitT/TauT family transport system substrate-binding protein